MQKKKLAQHVRNTQEQQAASLQNERSTQKSAPAPFALRFTQAKAGDKEKAGAVPKSSGCL